jgi:hypothetical protein
VGSAQRLYNENLTQIKLEFDQFLDMAVEGDWEEMARNELDAAKKTSCVMWSASETFINPLPGYD